MQQRRWRRRRPLPERDAQGPRDEPAAPLPPSSCVHIPIGLLQPPADLSARACLRTATEQIPPLAQQLLSAATLHVEAAGRGRGCGAAALPAACLRDSITAAAPPLLAARGMRHGRISGPADLPQIGRHLPLDILMPDSRFCVPQAHAVEPLPECGGVLGGHGSPLLEILH